MVLKVTKITDFDDLLSLAPEWEKLDAGLHPRVPFTTPQWCLMWWKNFSRDALYARDQLHAYAIRDADGRLVCVAPMFVCHRPGRGPVRTKELQFFGADHNVTELRGPICKPENLPEVVNLLTEQIKLDNCSDWVQWRGLRITDGEAKWPPGIALDEAMQTTDYILPLAESWDALRSRLPRNIKESLRKCYNALARDEHKFVIRVVERPEDMSAALDTFFELHQSRASKTDTIRHGDVFGLDAARNLLIAYCQEMAQQGKVKIFQMIIEGRPIATRIGFAFGDELYLYYSGYDVEWQRYSVMTTVVAEAIKWAIANRFKLVNLSTGTDVSKTRWRPDAIVFQGGIAIASDLKSRSSYYVVDRLRRAAANKGNRAATETA